MLNVKYTLTRCHRVRDGQYATEASAGMSRFRSEIDLVDFIRDQTEREGTAVTIVSIELI